MVKDIKLDGSSWPAGFVAVDGTTYLVAGDGSHGRELWSSDGTRAGTSLVKDIWPGWTPESSASCRLLCS